MKYPNIKAEMARNGTTIKELASKLKLSSNSVSFKLNGKREFTLSEIEKIANYFNVSLDYLVGHEILNKNTTTQQFAEAKQPA